jgi:hypothetical protein
MSMRKSLIYLNDKKLGKVTQLQHLPEIYAICRTISKYIFKSSSTSKSLSTFKIQLKSIETHSQLEKKNQEN